MKEKDLLLISYLRQNARDTLTRLSRRTNIPVSTIFDRLKNYERRGTVKHTAIVDFTKLGFHTRAKIAIKVARDERQAAGEYLAKHPNVNSVCRINNGYSFLFEGVFRNIVDLENFLEELDEKFEIAQKQVFYVIDDIIREGFMSNPDLALSL